MHFQNDIGTLKYLIRSLIITRILHLRCKTLREKLFSRQKFKNKSLILNKLDKENIL